MFLKNIKIFHIVFFVCILNFLVRIPFANIYLIFDEVVDMGGYASMLFNNLNIFTDYWGYKPPILFWIPAALSYFVGANQIIPRLTIYLYSSLLLFFVYLIGRDIFKNEKVGLWSIVILFFYPLFMVQSFLYHDQIPTSLFFTMSFYFLYTSKFKWYILSSIMLVMTRELGLIAIGIFALFDLFIHKRGLIQTIKLHSLSIIIFGIWMLLNKYHFGWYLWPTNVGYFDLSIFLNSTIYFNIRDFFIDGFIIVFLIFAFNQKNKEYKKYFYLFLIIFLINGLASSCVMYMQRYWFFPVPILIILFVNSIFEIFDKKIINKILSVVLFMIILNHFVNLTVKNDYYYVDTDLLIFRSAAINYKTIKSASMACTNNCFYLYDSHIVKDNMQRGNLNINGVHCNFDDVDNNCLTNFVSRNNENLIALVRYDDKMPDFLLNNNFKLYEKKCDKNIFGEETAECYKIYVRYVNN